MVGSSSAGRCSVALSVGGAVCGDAIGMLEVGGGEGVCGRGRGGKGWDIQDGLLSMVR